VKSIHSNQLLPGVHTMTQCNVIAIDLAKDIFQVCIMTTNGKIMKLEGVGPITSMRLKIQLGSGEHFKSSRQVSACIGLTPKQHSSGGKVQLGSVGKSSCDKPLRSCLFFGGKSRSF